MAAKLKSEMETGNERLSVRKIGVEMTEKGRASDYF